MKWIVLGSRLILGGVFVLFGLNGFVQFIPIPELAPEAAEFMGLLHGSGYLTVVKLLEIVGGALVLAGFRVPLGLTLLGPVLVNILLFHLFFDLAGLPLGIVLTVVWGVLFWNDRKAFAGVLGTGDGS